MCMPDRPQATLGGNVGAKARIQERRNTQILAVNERTSKGIDLLIMMDITGVRMLGVLGAMRVLSRG